MSTAAPCPAAPCLSATELEAVLQGSLTEDDLQRLTQHIGQCTTCQEALQLAATGELAIEQLVAEQSRNQVASDSAYWKAIQAVGTVADAKATTVPDSPDDAGQRKTVGLDANEPKTDTESPSGAAGLSFLQPSDDPAYLGKLDHFQIARVIGRGGMGIVLEAFDSHLQRQVAIKVLNPEFAKNEVARKRFCREGRAAAAISHEHVVSMYQVAKESEGQVAYLVMQLIEGDTLEKRLATAPRMLPQEVALIGMQIAAGLSAAHARGMVHRDIKPANVLLERTTNRVKLTDFGLARASDDVRLTRTGMVAGTPLYMSPEQAMGVTADERSDLFSFGAVLYEMATGASPFQAPSIVGVMKRVMDETPTPPHKLNAAVPRKLSDTIMALLEKRPEDRPESAAAVAQVLAGVVSEFGPISPLQVPSVSHSDAKRLSGRYRTMSRRVSGVLMASAALGLLLLGAATGVLFSRWQTEAPNKIATDDSRFPSVVLAGNPGTVWSVDFVPEQDRVAAAIEDGSVRIWDIPTRRVIKSFNAHRGIVWMIQHHPTKPIVATSGDDGVVKLWNADTYELIREWKAESAVRSIAFSANGRLIAAGDRAGLIHIYDIESGEEIQTRSQNGSIFGIAYSSDGKLIATVGTDRVVRVWDANSLEERQSFTGHDGPIYNVAFAPNSPRLATVGWNKDVHIWNVENGQEERRLTDSTGDVWGVSFCSSGDHLVTSGQDGLTRLWDLAAGKQVAILGGHESAVHNISLDPANHRIATSGRDGTIRIWDLSDL